MQMIFSRSRSSMTLPVLHLLTTPLLQLLLSLAARRNALGRVRTASSRKPSHTLPCANERRVCQVRGVEGNNSLKILDLHDFDLLEAQKKHLPKATMHHRRLRRP